MSRAVDSWSKAELCRRMPLFQLLIMLMCQCNSATGLRFVAFRPILYARITQPRSWHAQAVLSLTPKVQPQKIFLTLRGQQISPTGVLMGLSVFCTAFIVQLPVFIAYLWSQLFDKKKRCRGVDWIIHFWAWASMAICGYCPEVTGLHNLEGLSNALFVPNHTSFLDILTLSGFVPKPMKYVSKKDILKIPLIGWPMKLAGHIPLQTESRRSQLQTFKDTVKSLQDGNSVITFPEGGRSIDGRIMPFKRGPFKMALRAQTPIVPVSICGLAQWYPKGTLIPLAVPKGVRVVVHPPIQVSSEMNMDEGDLCDRVYSIVNNALPEYQQGPRLVAGETK